MTIDDVLKLSHAGVSDDVITRKIVKSGQTFDLSTDEILKLKSAGISDRVIQAMLGSQPTSEKSAEVTTSHENDLRQRCADRGCKQLGCSYYPRHVGKLQRVMLEYVVEEGRLMECGSSSRSDGDGAPSF